MNTYLTKYSFQSPKINTKPSNDVGIIVVIPCYNEENLLETIKSIENCEKPTVGFEVIVIINQSEKEDEKICEVNSKTYEALSGKIFNFPLHLIFEKKLPKKHAGVGLARKIGMDEAVYRFHQIENKEGILVCLDADCEVSNNYLVEIEQHFKKYPKSPGCSIYFEHPLGGNLFPNKIYEAIIDYELFLRYYNLSLQFVGLPYSFHTVGSSMAVKTWAYQKQGGMNKRKAGEDFYFLHKIIALGNFTVLNSCCVFPSPRISDRVPFGTGKAVGDIIKQTEPIVYSTYDFNIFKVLKEFVLEIENMYKTDTYKIKQEVLLSFFEEDTISIVISEIKANTTNYDSFKKRFFNYFDAFKVLKLIHYVRDKSVPNKEIKGEVCTLLHNIGHENCLGLSKKELLLLLRQIERKYTV